MTYVCTWIYIKSMVCTDRKICPATPDNRPSSKAMKEFKSTNQMTSQYAIKDFKVHIRTIQIPRQECVFVECIGSSCVQSVNLTIK